MVESTSQRDNVRDDVCFALQQSIDSDDAVPIRRLVKATADPVGNSAVGREDRAVTEPCIDEI